MQKEDIVKGTKLACDIGFLKHIYEDNVILNKAVAFFDKEQVERFVSFLLDKELEDEYYRGMYINWLKETVLDVHKRQKAVCKITKNCMDMVACFLNGEDIEKCAEFYKFFVNGSYDICSAKFEDGTVLGLYLSHNRTEYCIDAYFFDCDGKIEILHRADFPKEQTYEFNGKKYDISLKFVK